MIITQQLERIFKFIMNQPEDFKRKISGITTFKSTGPLIAMPIKERKKTDVSRQKEDKKPMINQDKMPAKLILQHQDQNTKNTKAINFRNLKDTLPKKEIPYTKTQIKIGKNNPDYFFKTNKQHPPEPHGIPINVNIQGVLPKQNQNHEHFLKNQRSILVEDKRKQKKPMITHNKNIVEDLECTEQINFKWAPVDKKTKPPPEKHARDVPDKAPLIDKKVLRCDTHQRSKSTVAQQKQMIKKLEIDSDQINSAFEAEALMQMDQRQNLYLVPPHYIEKNQKNFNWMMRVILVEWMMHVSYEFSMKRQTFHIAVNLIDLYMSKEHHLPKSYFQLVGAASMFIASKLEEFEPKCSEDFAKTTKGRYTADQIKEMQLKICKTLKYKLNPPTIYMWANRFILQWDIYIEQNPYAKHHPLFTSKTPSYFKKYDKDSLRLYRELMQYIDCALLHIHTVQYKPKLLACAFIYLVLGADLQIFSKSEIASEFPDSSQYLLDYENPFNDLFMAFLEESLGIILIDLLPTIQYAASFFLLALSFQDPLIPEKIRGEQVNQNQINFQEYCSFQTHNPNMTLAIKHRNKNLR